MPRTTPFGVSLGVLGLSTAVHAAALLAPLGHPLPPSSGAVELNAPTLMEALREPAEATPAAAAPTWPAPTPSNPVAPSHDRTPHDPNLVHPAVLPALAAVPASAMAQHADATPDDSPRFTIAIGNATTGADCVGSSPASAGPSRDADVPVLEQSVDAPARLVRGPPPEYPARARADGIEGVVHLELVVGGSGAVESARVVRGVGYGLDEAAMVAVRQFRFAPASKAGRTVRVRMAWSVAFSLR